MTLQTQFELKKSPYYIMYLRNNSIWYKLLNRNPSLIDKFVEEVKVYYKLRNVDKIEKAINTFNMIQNVLTSIK